MREANSTRVTLPWFAGVCLVIALCILGLVGPVFRQMLEDVGATHSAQLWFRVIARLHWLWTTPVGLVAAAVLIAGSKRWSQGTTRVVGTAFLVIAFAIVAGLLSSMWMPIRIDYGVGDRDRDAPRGAPLPHH